MVQNTRFTDTYMWFKRFIVIENSFPNVFRFPCSDSLTCHCIKIRRKGRGWSMSNVLFTIATIFYTVYVTLLYYIYRGDGIKSNMCFYFDSNLIRKFLFEYTCNVFILYNAFLFFLVYCVCSAWASWSCTEFCC